jgi:hypothetical protein
MSYLSLLYATCEGSILNIDLCRSGENARRVFEEQPVHNIFEHDDTQIDPESETEEQTQVCNSSPALQKVVSSRNSIELRSSIAGPGQISRRTQHQVREGTAAGVARSSMSAYDMV